MIRAVAFAAIVGGATCLVTSMTSSSNEEEHRW